MSRSPTTGSPTTGSPTTGSTVKKTLGAALLIAALVGLPGTALVADEPPPTDSQEEVEEEHWWDPILEIWVDMKETTTGAKIEGDG